ncbi:MAG: hypothetical protein R3F49_01715 [Planctomycetota bacterium]
MTTLVLVPTALEAARLAALGGFRGMGRGGSTTGAVASRAAAPPNMELVGFGPVAAAARAAQLFHALRPTRALLVGIAGSYSAEGGAPLGRAQGFGAVRLDGVGAGAGAGHLLPSAVGFPQWQDAEGAVYEELPLAGTGPVLLCVAAAAASPREVAERRARHPAAVGEDMEAFGVALAARLARVPLYVVRGWSNQAGDRDVRRWDIQGALAAAHALAQDVLERLEA